MLKLLYKTLLISVLSCSLMTMDFTSKGLVFQSAQAQQKETLKTEGAKDSSLTATLTMTAIGLLTSRLFSCKMTTDMMLAAAGGAAYVGGEILATLKLRKVMKDLETEIERDSKGNVNAEQVKSLERLKKSYVEAKKTAGMKKMLQTAAAAAFLAAAAMSYMLVAKEKAAVLACKSAITAGGAACNSAFAASCAGAGATCVYPFQTAAVASGPASTVPVVNNTTDDAAVGPSPGLQAASVSKQAALEATLTSIATQCPAAGGITAPCKAIAAVNLMTKGYCPMPPAFGATTISTYNPQLYANAFTPVKQESSLSNIFRQVILSDAKADLFSPLGIASSAAIAFLLMTNKSLGTQIDMFIFSPMKRAVIWGVLAGLTYMASSATDGVIKKLESNIEKIDNILNNLNSMAQATTTTNVNNPGVTNATNMPNVNNPTGVNVGATNYDAVDLTGEGGGSLPCFTGGTAGNCKSFNDVAKDLPSFAGLDSASQQQVQGILSTGNAFNGTSKISSAALENAAKLAGNANALRSASEAAKKKAMDALKASGSKINPDAIGKKFSSDMEKAVAAALKKSNSSAADMMASMYGGKGAFGSGSDSANAVANKPIEDNAKKSGVGAAGGVIDLNAGYAPGDAGLSGIDTGAAAGNGNLSAEELAKLNGSLGGTEKALGEFDLNKSEISTDANSNLFELISNRYQRSGYPRLFKVKEAQEESAPIKK